MTNNLEDIMKKDLSSPQPVNLLVAILAKDYNCCKLSQKILEESFGGNAGSYKGVSCAGANFYYDKMTGEIMYFGNMQNVPEGIRNSFIHGTFRIAITKYGIVENYLDELEELKSNSSSKTTTTKIVLNTTIVENYFCPEDDCIKMLQQKLNSANKSVYFATYSFTHPKIANELIIKNSEGVKVKGIIETSGKYSQLQPLQQHNIAIKDGNKKLLHHKFFIIDNEIVITGSFNPTRNGDTRNDENILIIHSEEIAYLYKNEFLKIMSD